MKTTRPPSTPYAECWFWPLFLLEAELHGLSDLAATMENFLEDEVEKLRADKRDLLEPSGTALTWEEWHSRVAELDVDNTDAEWDEWFGKLSLFVDEFPPLLRSTLVISVVAKLEKALGSICEELQAVTAQPAGLDHDRRGSVLHLFGQYVQEAAGLRFPFGSPALKAVKGVYSLRNKLVHGGLDGLKLNDIEFGRLSRIPGVRLVPVNRTAALRPDSGRYMALVDATCLVSAIDSFLRFGSELEESFSRASDGRDA